MPLYSKYIIKSDDHFDAYYFPNIVAEVARINEVAAHIPPLQRASTIIKLAKRKPLSEDVLPVNVEVHQLLQSGKISLLNISSLLQASAGNEQFTRQLEDYLSKELGG